MQISLKWINELVNIETLDLDDLINKLTLGGFEVEEILEIEIEKEKIFALDISATANRSDSLSIQGLSLEIAALLQQTPSISNYSTTINLWSDQFSALQSRRLTQRSCSGFFSLTIENLNDFRSPKWLQQKLLASGITPENNLLDFQNYVLLETGYPVEIYDLDKIHSELNESSIQLSLMSNHNLKTFCASNNINYIVDNSILILKANDLPISIGGIISSKTSQYSNNTTSLLVEGSIFDAAKIRQESRKLGLRTDRSSRYEKSLKNINLSEALYRFSSLLRINNPNLICKLHTIAEPKLEPIQTIELNYETIKQVLGPIKASKYEYISPTIVTNSLKRLQFDVNYDDSKRKWKVTIPPLRNEDITREIDLIEEIGRIYGFNNFLTRLPQIKQVGYEDFDYQIRKKLTACLINLGLNELIQYSLLNKKTYLNNEVELINPLVKDYSNLRLSLLPNLLKSVEENLKKNNSILEGFEYGHVFSNNSISFVEETEHIAGIFGGVKTKSNWSDSSKLLSWFEAKGRMDQLFRKLNISSYFKLYQPIKEKNIFHSYCTAKIFLTNGTQLGIFGKVSPILAKKLNISTETYLFEFSFEAIKKQLKENKLVVYQDYSFYPKIIKDLSFIIHKDIPFINVQKLLYLNGSQFLKEINLLDEYRGASIPQHQTSLCLQLIFQSESETLQTSKVEKIVTNLTDLLTQNFDASIRI